MTMPSVTVSREFKPVSIKRTGPDQYLVDFGQAMAGFVKLKVTGKPGTEITVKYGELIGKDGHLDQRNIDGLVDVEPFQTDTYILGRNQAKKFLHPRFSYSGFQAVDQFLNAVKLV